MPIRITTPSGKGQTYGSPFVGPVDHTLQISVDASALTNAEIDTKGYIKPGIPLKKDGTLVAATQAVFGVTVEAVKVADDNAAGTIAALGSVELAVAVIAVVNQAAVEDMLGRALTADEIAGFNLAGSKVVLA